MSLSRSQYDAVMRVYDKRQLEDHRIMEDRRKRAYDLIPELREIDRQTADSAVERLRRSLMDIRDAAAGDAPAMQNMAGGQIAAGQTGAGSQKAEAGSRKTAEQGKTPSPEERKRRLLIRHGFPEDYLDPVYTCPDCRDTGYVENKKCHCFRQAVVELFYTQSGLAGILEKENFDTFSLDWYPQDLKDPASGLSSRALMERVLSSCRGFADNYDHLEKPFLLLSGESGRGKTFLSHCIAKALIDSAHSVIYYSAKDLFDHLADLRFRPGRNEDSDGFDADYILSCDLLIIDDLGTEMPNDFTKSEFFSILNNRLSEGRGIIISTNLSPQDISDTYSPRIMSRILENFSLQNLFGKDIRILRRVAGKA